MDLPEHLFRNQSGRMVSALTRALGVQNLALAEDAVQEAFCRAIEVWGFRGVPENPTAWLLTTAKNCALDALRRQRTARNSAAALAHSQRNSDDGFEEALGELLDESFIEDDLLRMMFSCCHPRLRRDAQVALILNILCGFSVEEVASAFVDKRAATEKRIARAKAVLARTKRLFDVSSESDFGLRLPPVHTALYLLFSEGYHGASAQFAVRRELCSEAMRLMAILLTHPFGQTPASYALAALMCFDAARLPARIDVLGQLSVFGNQDRATWDTQLISEGARFLELSAAGREVTAYHIESAIAAEHAMARSVEETDWRRVVALYDSLLKLQSGPIVALNRAIALAQRDGAEKGLEEIFKIEDAARLASYPFYFAAIGELEMRLGRMEAACAWFARAEAAARNPAEACFLAAKRSKCHG